MVHPNSVICRVSVKSGNIVNLNNSPDLSSLAFFFWGMLKEKVYSTKITDSIHLTQRTKSECTKIDGNADLLHRVLANFVKRSDICIANNGAHIKDVI